MERMQIILLTGIIIGLIWILMCVIIEDKYRKHVIMAGIIIDFVLFIICRNLEMLLIGLAGGLLFGFLPINPRKYETAVEEMKGVKNLVVVTVIFFIMMFMVMAIAWPGIKIDFSKW